MATKKNKNKKLDIFNDETFEFVNSLIESKIEILHTCENYNINHKLLSNDIDKLRNNLEPDDRNILDEIIHTFYTIKDYHSVFSYFLGIKFGLEMKNM